jgi:rsbT co-antagonist protein RsbR
MDLSHIFSTHKETILDRWVKAQAQTKAGQALSVSDLERQSTSLLRVLATPPPTDGSVPGPVRDALADLSRNRAVQGFSPTDTATVVLALKDAIQPALEKEYAREPARLAAAVRDINRYFDQLALLTFEAYVAGREEIIRKQASAIMDLGTPVVEVWDGILLLPIVGIIDTQRSQKIMESMLEQIVASGASMVLIDITGVSVVDTAVAGHLIQTFQAARLLGAEVVLCGISSKVAQTMVQLGVDLGEMTTRASLAKGLKHALALINGTVRGRAED